MRRAAALLGPLCALVTAGCASSQVVTLSGAEIKRAYDEAPWDDRPGDTIIDPSAYTAATCRMQTATRARCSFRYRYGEDRWLKATQTLDRASDGTWSWVFDRP